LLWTRNAYALVGLPTHGQGRHPTGKDLGFDGRGKNKMAAAGTIDDQEHRGMIGWVIERTADESEANLALDEATWSAEVSVKFPGGKKRKAEVSWDSKHLPSLPIIINPKAIAAHTRLLLHFVSAKSKEVVSPASEKKPPAEAGSSASGSAKK
jgi:hypothetical protein